MKTNNIIKKILPILCIAALGILAKSCNEDLFLPEDIRNSIEAPIITDFEPKTGSIGTEIIVSGENLATVTSVYIGGGRTEILHRYTNFSMVIKLIGTEVTGPIAITNSRGTTTSTEIFVVIDNVPENVTFRNSDGTALTELVDERRVVINGRQLNAVRRVTFGEDLTVGRLIDRNDSVLIVEVPYFERDVATINLEYMAGGKLQVFSSESFPVNNVFIPPTITNTIPEETTPNRIITLQGSHLDRVSEVFLEGHRDSIWTIISQSRTVLRVLVPAFPDGLTAGELTLVHNREKQEMSVGMLRVVNEDVLNFSVYRRVTMWVNRMPEQENFNNFFDANDGQLYTPCDWEAVSIAGVTTFFFSISANTVQLNNPAASVAQFQNFRCDGEQVLQGMRGANATRYTRLNYQANAAQAALREKVLTGMLDSLHLDMFDGTGINIANLGSSNPRWRGSTAAAPEGGNWDIDDVLVFREYTDWTGDGVGGVGGRFGFIHIMSVNPGPNFDPANPGQQTDRDRRQSQVTISVWFQKEAE
jgi:hypothetical protein